MKLYARNNIVKTRCNDMFYIAEVGEEYLHLLNREQDNYTLIEKADIYLKDIEMSDWLLDNIFKKEKGDSWIVDSLHAGTSDIPYFKIEKDESGEAYLFTREGKFIMYIDYVRELQNAYHFSSDIECGDFLNDDIDTKLKKLFKLI